MIKIVRKVLSFISVSIKRKILFQKTIGYTYMYAILYYKWYNDSYNSICINVYYSSKSLVLLSDDNFNMLLTSRYFRLPYIKKGTGHIQLMIQIIAKKSGQYFILTVQY